MKKQHWQLLLLSSLLLLSGCDLTSSSSAQSTEESSVESSKTSSSDTTSEASTSLLPPEDYELDEMITNKDGSVYYEIFVRSFADSNNDGKGDLQGIASKIPYLKTLGVKGLWLTPIHPSPSYHGYDVEDYYGINKDFGTLSDFDHLITTANNHNIDIIIDLVLNHSSSTHPWYIEGRNRFRSGNYDANDPYDKANWYNFYWSGNNVKAAAVFGDWMPDLNLENPALREEIRAITHFWLDRGVKGFRLDATSHFYPTDSGNVQFLEWFTNVVKEKRPDYYNVAEAWISFSRQKQYYNGIESLFNFNTAGSGGLFIDSITKGRGDVLGRDLENYYADMRAVNLEGLMSNFLSNHDMDRSSRMFLMDYEERQKLAASMYLLTPGVPFMYYGEEIGLKGSRGAAQTDADRRLPMIWQRVGDEDRTDVPPGTTYNMREQVQEGVKEGLETPFSLLNHYRKVINIRNRYPWFNFADFTNLPLNSRQLAAFKINDRDNKNDALYIVHNLHNDARSISVSELGDIELYIDDELFTDGVRAEIVDDTLIIGKYSSVILKEKTNA